MAGARSRPRSRPGSGSPADISQTGTSGSRRRIQVCGTGVGHANCVRLRRHTPTTSRSGERTRSTMCGSSTIRSSRLPPNTGLQRENGSHENDRRFVSTALLCKLLPASLAEGARARAQHRKGIVRILRFAPSQDDAHRRLVRAFHQRPRRIRR